MWKCAFDNLDKSHQKKKVVEKKYIPTRLRGLVSILLHAYLAYICYVKKFYI